MPYDDGALGLDEKPYDLLAQMQELLNPIDVSDKIVLVRRAIQMHALSIALYFPRLSQLEASRKGTVPNVDMIALARRHAAVKLYQHYASPIPRSHPPNSETVRSSTPVKKGLSIRFKRVQFLKEFLALESGGLSVLLDDPSLGEYASLFSSQPRKSKAVSILIKAYTTNGTDLKELDRKLNRYPLGLQTMRFAVCDEKRLFNKSEKTLDNAFVELEPTSVFHYMIHLQGYWDLLRPIYPGSPIFAQRLLRRARGADEFVGMCRMYNTIASQLNSEYGFSFCTIENVLEIEGVNTPTPYPYDKDLAKSIKKVTGVTG